MDQARITHIKDFREPVLRIDFAVLSFRFAVTVVKVLHFIDGVKVYV